MTDVTYTQLVNLINNSGLTVDEEYRITDYPTIQPVVKARTEDELWRDSYAAGGYKLLYDPFNDNSEYGWSSNYGWVYYLEDSNGNSAWYDWKNSSPNVFTNSTNIHIGPGIYQDQLYVPAFISATDSSDITVGGDCDINFNNCHNCIVGEGNSGVLRNLDNVTMGDNNWPFTIENSSNITVGDSNKNLIIKSSSGIEVGSRNEGVNILNSTNVIGSDNKNIQVSGESNEIGNGCNSVTVNSDVNSIDTSCNVELNSRYNTIISSNGISLTGSVGNRIEDSNLVYLEQVNNNDIWVTNYVDSPNAYTTPNGDVIQYSSGVSVPFRTVRNRNQQKVGKVTLNNIADQTYQVDNAALVIDTVNNTRKNSTKSDDDYFIGNDGLWNTENINTDEYDIILVISKTDSQKCYVSGAGRYQNGAICEIGYSWIEPGFEAVFTDENGNVHEGPYTIIVSENQKIYVTLTNVTPQQVPFYVEDITGNANTLSIKKTSNTAPTIEPYYSTDGTNWTSMGTTSTTAITATIPANGKLYLKCTTDSWGQQSGYYNNTITASGDHNVGGNIMSLLMGDNYENTTLDTNYNKQFYYLFRNNTHLVDASDLELPSNVAESCYIGMFYGCTALTTAPALPATTLVDACYEGMFYSCTSLTTAPILPATTLAFECYYYMFDSCTSLNSVTTYADNISATGCLTNWLSGVAATGDFYKLGSATYTSGASGIPTGWNIHNVL